MVLQPAGRLIALQSPGERATFMGQWRALFAQVGHASPFLTPSWVAQWLEVHAALAPVGFRATDATGAVIGLALLVPGVRRRGPLAFRQLFLNTDGERAEDSVVVENNAVLVLPDREPQALQALAAQVTASGVHEFIASGVSSAQLAALRRAFSHWHADVVTRPSSVVDLAQVRAHGGDLLPLLSANTRGQLRRAMRKLEQQGPLSVEVAQSSSDALHFWEELIALHEVSWQARGAAGAFASPARRAMHLGVAQRGVPAGEACLLRVRCGAQTIGALYFLTANGSANFYQSGFAPFDDPHVKVGMVSHCLAIRHFAQIGFMEYDFLASLPGEGRYKQSLATGERPLHWLELARPTLRNALLRVVRRLR